ncbi:MAG: GNAT family N-acetyltransferase [Planctomycetota bacterium]
MSRPAIITSHTSAHELALIEGRRLAKAMRELSGEHIDVAGGAACFLAQRSWMNCAVGCGTDPDQPLDAAALDRITDFFHRRGVDATIDFPHTVVDHHVKTLAACGYRMREGESQYLMPLAPGMGLPGLPEGVEVEEFKAGVSTEADETWLRLNHLSEIGDEPNTPVAVRRDERERILHHPRSRLFVARLDGEPVGAAGMEATDEVAVLFGGTVIREARRRGVQRAMMLARLRLAADDGCPVALIGSDPDGPTARNAERLGFRLGFVVLEFCNPLIR